MGEVKASAMRGLCSLKAYQASLAKSEDTAKKLVEEKADLEKAKEIVEREMAAVIIAEGRIRDAQIVVEREMTAMIVAEGRIRDARIVIERERNVITGAEQRMRYARIAIRAREMMISDLESEEDWLTTEQHLYRVRLIREDYVLVEEQHQIDALATLKKDFGLEFSICVKSFQVLDEVKRAGLKPEFMIG